ncbi:hypothetical protein P152DRAFT_493604 [Eremomyces bilateralis CBS 781.70]|uniref:CHAT domain-containing protein n=1 Tax=Eremomyces bilateralis CBS 781.70 TaxID=1392243 RepID=A0A6G1FVW9_9PEZI|nr:uncharacterized protein P152DRAFT_493604 [Eremomyces bilateralis CBS 781.70]KAF1809923.1 hypothetical protein P152DRAFT_493604 [Eremomyces bilateralis CBS 781.70]
MSASEAGTWMQYSKRFKPDNKVFREYLSWLWKVCVRPILVEGNFGVQQSKQDLPSVWWIGTGLASSMPFHAAGHHSPQSEENVFNRAISSYAPSIKALVYARERSLKRDVIIESLLLVTMRKTPPDLPSLDGVEHEKKAILKSIHTYLKTQLLDHPNADTSGLVFHKDDSDYISGLMTVQAVSGLKLERSRIAYISACSIPTDTTVKLRDEAIHIMSGFQVAGFAHVIGFLWHSVDRVCVKVAKRFYESLFRGEDTKVEDIDVAMAFHESVPAVRVAYRNQPLIWAQFVHYGA